MIQFKETFITPELAKNMLIQNTHNRKVKLSAVERYANDIKQGRWKNNTGEAIKVAESGRILDGQHRLHAIIKADTGATMHIASGLSDETFDVIDTGVTRGAADVFFIDGITNYSILPSIIQSFTLIKKNGIKSKTYALTNQEVLIVYNSNPEEWQNIVKKAHNYYEHFSKILNKSLIGGLYATFKNVSDEQTATNFFDQLCIGRDYTNEVIPWLRKRLTEDKIANSKLPIASKYELIIKAWNAYRKGKQIKSLRLTGEIEKIL